MSGLPTLRAKNVIRALERADFEVIRISGSHYRMRHKMDAKRPTTVPFHTSRDLPKGTLRDIIDRCGLTIDEFLGYL